MIETPEVLLANTEKAIENGNLGPDDARPFPGGALYPSMNTKGESS